MNLVCLDLEGVLAPEMWISLAEASGIPELRVTTREEPDYNKLMRRRIEILDEHNLSISDIQEILADIKPLDGAKEFLDELRTIEQTVILSDTFTQFAKPLMRQLGWPTLFCNELVINEKGMVVDFHMRCEHSKLTTIRSLQACGFEPICAGDSFNDLDMIRNGKAGFLFQTTDSIKHDFPEIPAYETYDELLSAIKQAL